MITDKMIEEEASKVATKWVEEDDQPKSFQHTFYGFQAGAKFAQGKIIEMASEDYEEWFREKFHGLEFESEEMYFSCKYEHSTSWQAATIASEKKHRERIEALELEQVRHIEIIEEQFKKEREEMKEALIDYVSIAHDFLAVESLPHLDHHFEIFEKHAKLIEKLKEENNITKGKKC